MKTLVAFTAFLIAGFALGGCASTRQNTAEIRPVRLQLAVDVPPNMSILYDEEIAEAFGYRVSAVLHEEGMRGRIRYLDRWETPQPDVPLLTAQLREWRVDRTGTVDCTFTASIQLGGETKALGLFTGTSFMTWPRHDWYARAEGFEDAARDAVGTLATRLEQSGFLNRTGR
jgi:hypothetical protein